ncbi:MULTISPECIES: hypothetical protein [unclassified Streptomyces]|uniref:hypothetical protein n=1 Tax=unclassified Streptomyces TaxID=2593676 RepID=UPI0022AF87D4|nr:MULTISPECIES: hypothetical protein [unclassified Streptomyces]MCZ4097325.1 hypothetical protein [Streptomyces sp. H39-C1]MCZ4120629.1 hypothetical protein [Streptomyces sp. H39-S7]
MTTTHDYAGFSVTFRPAPNLEITFAGDTPLTVGPNVSAFVHAASRYADLFSQAQVAFNLSELGATVVHTTSN